jgi:hypothetical protein
MSSQINARPAWVASVTGDPVPSSPRGGHSAALRSHHRVKTSIKASSHLASEAEAEAEAEHAATAADPFYSSAHDS